MAQELLQAATNNDITDLEIKLRSCFPSNISQGPPPCLIKAIELNNFAFVREFLRLRPEIVWNERLRDGKAMHVSCEKGNAKIVKILAKRHPELCHVKDHEGRSAVHIAAIGGKLRVLKTLTGVSPLSLRHLTSVGETALHVALKYNQFRSFEVLFQELRKGKQENVLDWKDHDQNTVLHIATLKKQTKILQLLLLNNGPIVDVKSKNGNKLTALDLHYQTYQSGRSDKYISDLLHSAEEKQAHHVETLIKTSDKMTFSLTVKAFYATLCVCFIGGSYAGLSNFGSAYPPGNYGNAILLRAQDMIFAPKQVPDGFFYILFTSETFTLGMGWLLIIVFSLDGIWSFRFKVAMLFLEILTFTSFTLLARKLVPRFKVSFSGSSNISSFSLLCFCNLGVIFLCAVLFLIKPLFGKVSTRIKGKESSEVEFNHVMRP